MVDAARNLDEEIGGIGVAEGLALPDRVRIALRRAASLSPPIARATRRRLDGARDDDG